MSITLTSKRAVLTEGKVTKVEDGVARGLPRSKFLSKSTPAKGSKMTIFRFDPASGNLGIFSTKKAAAAEGNGATFSSEAELVALTELDNKALLALHNSLTETPVKKFANRDVAARRCWALLELKASETKAAEKANGKAPAAAKPEKAAKAPKGEKAAAPAGDGEGRRGKVSRYSGKRLHPLKTTNPRRAGTHGFRSFELIREKPGITYEDYMSAGGRGNDLQWDIDKGYVEVK